MKITVEELQKVPEAINESFGSAQVRVLTTLERTKKNPAGLLRFMNRYATWNGRFASGVAALVALIGDSQDLFLEPGYPRPLADRSNYIASFIFDAARDEFNDHITRGRDPHRSLAQATVSGITDFFDLDSVLEEQDPLWLKTLASRTVRNYIGGTLQFDARDPLIPIFSGIGYHLGSELLADREFSLIDNHLRNNEPELVKFLLHETVKLADCKHRCYAWIGVHSGSGGAVEADHFSWGLEGVNLALKLVSNKDLAYQAIVRGFMRFYDDHRTFFEECSRVPVYELPVHRGLIWST